MTDAKPLLVPQVNANDEVVIVVQWIEQPGSWVEPGTPVVEIETTKAVVEVEAEASGFLAPCAEAGTSIDVGKPIAWLQSTYDPDNIPVEKAADVSQVSGRLISQDAQSLLTEHGLEAANVPGNGPIRRADVERLLKGGNGSEPFDWDRVVAELPEDRNTLVIFGADLQGTVVLDCLRAESPEQPAVFVDDRPKSTELLGCPVLPSDSLPKLREFGYSMAHIAISNPEAKLACADRLRELGFSIPQVRHPTASISPSAEVGEGCFFGPLTLVGPEAEIGAFAQINNGASVAHHARVGVAARLSDGVRLAGSVRIGKGAFLGLGVTVNEKIDVGDFTTVVSGVSIFNHVPDNVIVKTDGKHYSSR